MCEWPEGKDRIDLHIYDSTGGFSYRLYVAVELSCMLRVRVRVEEMVLTGSGYE